MTVISLCSAKGAPGVTTLACGVAAVWPPYRRVALAECDPSGGDLAARFGISAKRGMASLAIEQRSSPENTSIRFNNHLQTLPGGLEVITGPSGASAARTVDSELPKILNGVVRGMARPEASDVDDLILDCGRVLPGAIGQVAALAAADLVLVVTRPTAEGITSARWIADLLSRSGQSANIGSGALTEVWSAIQGKRGMSQAAVTTSTADSAVVGLVIQGDGSISGREAASALNLQLMAVIPTDPLAAAWLHGDPVRRWRLGSSPLLRSARAIVQTHLKAHLDEGRPLDGQDDHPAVDPDVGVIA